MTVAGSGQIRSPGQKPPGWVMVKNPDRVPSLPHIHCKCSGMWRVKHNTRAWDQKKK